MQIALDEISPPARTGAVTAEDAPASDEVALAAPVMVTVPAPVIITPSSLAAFA